ncbi:MAG: hypothetical protein F9B45_15960 [Phycisphaera sp. RhM]|nr:hypothetical protein [Phycisphaera sp. RhM]
MELFTITSTVIASALRLPVEMNRGLLVTVTYAVVVFSIIVQGLTVGMPANNMIGREAEESAKTSV